jgi:hypothetical protein
MLTEDVARELVGIIGSYRRGERPAPWPSTQIDLVNQGIIRSTVRSVDRVIEQTARLARP